MLGASRHAREDFDAYFTIDDMCLDALLRAIRISPGARILEPAAGRGHLVKGLRAAGFDVMAQDLVTHADPLVSDIRECCVENITSLNDFDVVITNLPYAGQDALLEHLLPIAARDNCAVMTLTRAAWHLARKRRHLVHDHPNFEGVVVLPRRPWWSDDRRAAPRHEFVWNVWASGPRAGARPVIYYPSWETEIR